MAQSDLKRTVLVADDDPLLVAVVAHQLHAVGFDVLIAEDGAAALDTVRAQRPDIIVLDMLMPAMGGLEVLRRLRMEGRLDQCKVIVLTTMSEEQNVLTAFKLGASDFVAKPFSPDELALRIGRLLALRAA